MEATHTVSVRMGLTLEIPEYSSEPKYLFGPPAGGPAVDPIPKARFQRRKPRESLWAFYQKQPSINVQRASKIPTFVASSLPLRKEDVYSKQINTRRKISSATSRLAHVRPALPRIADFRRFRWEIL